MAVKRVALHVDRLDPRRLFSGAAATTLTIGPATTSFRHHTLFVAGTSANEKFIPIINNGRLLFDVETSNTGIFPPSGPTISDLSVTNTPHPPQFVVADEEANASSGFVDVKRIVIDAGAGNDWIDLSRLSIPSLIHGGAGNDTILGTSANDSLYGDAGNDAISDGAGNDLLVGGAGDDTLRAHSGIDTLLGQNGNDQLDSFHTSEDVLNGGTGQDSGTIDGGAPDAIAGFEILGGYVPTAVRGNPASLTLRRDGHQLFLDANITLPENDFAIDWDLVSESSNRVTIRATPYNSGHPDSAVTTTYTHTFVLDQSRQTHPVRVDLLQRDTLVASERFFISPTLGSTTRDIAGTDESIVILPADMTS